ncbi:MULTISPECIES: hypothetical protein [Clostridium]|uniref:Flavodoxin family protein n=1 Tax=Clostridium senegalense TaxID=1465809 RepID=A0A6M0H6P3_9CLOT|nr:MULTISPECIES: hypothetical protein [Clostridium]NEU06008.1 hypothetical protein [Clostridium senegalense]
MKTLLVFHSCNGLLKEVSHRIKKELNCEIIELQNIEPDLKNNNKYIKFFQDVLLVKKINEEFKEYECLILLFPSWFYKSYFGIKRSSFGNILNGKKVILITLGTDENLCFDKESLFLGCHIIGEKYINTKEIKTENFYISLVNWIKNICK